MSSSFYLIFPIQNRDAASHTWSDTGMEYLGYSGKIAECRLPHLGLSDLATDLLLFTGRRSRSPCKEESCSQGEGPGPLAVKEGLFSSWGGSLCPLTGATDIRSVSRNQGWGCPRDDQSAGQISFSK